MDRSCETNSTADSRSVGGNSTAAITAGGYHTTSPPTNTTNSESWNGSSWTEVSELNQKLGPLKVVEVLRKH